MLQTTVLERSADLAALESAWRTLLGPRPELVRTPTWVLSWWRVMGSTGGRALRAIAVRDAGGELVGLWPLLRRVALEKGAVPFRRLEMLGSGEDEADEVCSDYLGPIVAPGREAEVVDAMVEAVVSGAAGAWDDLLLTSMPEADAATDALLEAFRRRGIEPIVTADGACPYARLPASWDEYLAAQDGESRYFLRKTMRDFEAWAAKDGWTLDRVDSELDLEAGLRTLAELHEDRWSGGGVFRSAKFSAFHRHVMRDLLRGRDGRLDLLVLRVRGEPIAALYNLVVGDKTYFYQSGRRSDLPGKVRAGIVVHCIAIQRAIAEGQREYDFMKGSQSYKKKLGSASHSLVSVRVVRPAVTSRALDAALTGATRAARALRRALTAGRGRVAALRGGAPQEAGSGEGEASSGRPSEPPPASRRRGDRPPG